MRSKAGANAGSAATCSATRSSLAGQWTQRRVPVWIVEEAHVEHQIGVARQTAREAERRARQRQRRSAMRAEAFDNRRAQSCRERVGSVDHRIGPAPQRPEQLALGGDAVGGRTIERQRVTPPRFGKPPGQLAAAAIEEQQPHVETLGAERREARDDGIGIETPGARVDADRQRLR